MGSPLFLRADAVPEHAMGPARAGPIPAVGDGFERPRPVAGGASRSESTSYFSQIFSFQ
jgi:hypothetical protein